MHQRLKSTFLKFFLGEHDPGGACGRGVKEKKPKTSLALKARVGRMGRIVGRVIPMPAWEEIWKIYQISTWEETRLYFFVGYLPF